LLCHYQTSTHSPQPTAHIATSKFLYSIISTKMGPLPMPRSWENFWKTPLILRPCIFEFNAHLRDLEEHSIKVTRRKNRREQKFRNAQGSQKSPPSSGKMPPSSLNRNASSNSQSSKSSPRSPISQSPKGSTNSSCSSISTLQLHNQRIRKKVYTPKKFGHLTDEELKALLQEKGMWREESWVE